MTVELILAVILGLLVGAVLGVVGAGGSIIAVPALVYGVGLPLSQAIPSSLFVVGLGAIVAVVPRWRSGVDWKVAAIVAASGIPAAWLGTAVNRLVDPDVLLLAFAALMVIAGVRMLASGTPEGRERRTDRRSRVLFVIKAVGAGLLVGFLTGLLGVGGGFIIVPVLTLLLGLSMGRAVGTSLVIIIVNSLAGFTAHLTDLSLDWTLVLTFAGAAIGASFIAARFASKLADRPVRIAFAVVVLAVAAYSAWSSIVSLVGG